MSTLFGYLPGSKTKFVSINNTILIGLDRQLGISQKVLPDMIKVTGSRSGFHEGSVRITDDRKKIIFKPSTPFACNEIVNVEFSGLVGRLSKISSYTFTTQKAVLNVDRLSYLLNERSPLYDRTELPSVFLKGEAPDINVNIYNNPSPGKIFLTNFPFNFTVPNTPYLIITDNNGLPYYLKRSSGFTLDFWKQPNGNLTYYTGNKYYEMDPNYNIVDSFYCGNGYTTDFHECRVIDNHHALLMSYDAQQVDMSQIVAGGDPDAIVIGLVIQEIDANKDVVFQWRSWEEIPITDALHENLLDSVIDYVHGNAIELDNDGNILISSRHLDEITKIDRTEGDIIWRLGGRQNEFTFTNDPEKFTYQHAIRRLANGNIILYDNGNFHTPPHSRAVEYTLDEINKTATLAWQYRRTPDVYGFAMGFAQRLDNGNTLISWGSAHPTMTEVTPSGEIELELSLPQNLYTYRAVKFEWNGPSYIDPQAGYYPAAYKLGQNYPNPFNPVTTFTFDILEPGMVNLTIYDLLGKQVGVVVDAELKSRSYSIEYNASNLATGVYFYTLRSGSFVQTRKMILIK
jgi:Arylsulfotransferase (ASST)/Secretion system C-terminal sorting domain